MSPPGVTDTVAAAAAPADSHTAAPAAPASKEDTFRDFATSKRQARVEALYAAKYVNQTFAHATARKQEYCKFNRVKMSIWDALSFLNEVVDESDPDVDLPQLHHAFQTAEACRKQWPEADWFHLVGLIHDLGKVLATPKFGNLPQWEVVGDTFPVGCKPSPTNVLPHLFKGNPDLDDPRYNTEHGVYAPGCGLDQCAWAWGHDEYLALVLRNHKQCTLPDEAYAIIKYHSFYPWHSAGGYKFLESDKDRAMLPMVQRFQKSDLYSKDELPNNGAGLTDYYRGLIEKYVPGVLDW